MTQNRAFSANKEITPYSMQCLHLYCFRSRGCWEVGHFGPCFSDLIICSSLYSALSSNELKALYILYTPGTPVHTNTFSTPQLSIQPGYTLQGATGDQCTIAFSVYCQVLILWLSEPEHISGTNLAQGL